MVSLEHQTLFFKRLNDSPLQPLFTEIYSNKIGEFSDGSNNAGDLALNLLIAVKAGDKVKAEKFYAIFSKRQPTRDSHWIHDHYVLFCIVAAVTKFGFNTTWISNVINLSLSSANPIDKAIRETFKNLLAGNYNAKNDLHQISLVYQFLSKDAHYQDEHISKMFHELWLKQFPFFDDDFLNLISLKAIEVAFVKTGLLSRREEYYLKNFVPVFNRKAELLSNSLAWFIIIMLIVGIFYGLYRLNGMETDFPAFVKPVFFAISISGVGVLGVLGWKKTITKFIRKSIDSFFQFKSFEQKTEKVDLKS
jgi:hypothetical protein